MDKKTEGLARKLNKKIKRAEQTGWRIISDGYNYSIRSRHHSRVVSSHRPLPILIAIKTMNRSDKRVDRLLKKEERLTNRWYKTADRYGNRLTYLNNKMKFAPEKMRFGSLKMKFQNEDIFIKDLYNSTSFKFNGVEPGCSNPEEGFVFERTLKGWFYRPWFNNTCPYCKKVSCTGSCIGLSQLPKEDFEETIEYILSHRYELTELMR